MAIFIVTALFLAWVLWRERSYERGGRFWLVAASAALGASLAVSACHWMAVQP